MASKPSTPRKTPKLLSLRDTFFGGQHRTMITLLFLILFSSIGTAFIIDSRAATLPSLTDCRASTPYSVGSKGTCVRTYETFLNTNPYLDSCSQSGITVDSTYGTVTEQYVKCYQRNQGITVTGTINYQTATRVINTCKSNVQLYKNAGVYCETTTASTSLWQQDYPGQPRPGTVYWGSSYQSNADPATFEANGGFQLGVHRTFWQGTNQSVTDAVATAKDDLLNKRLPMVSFKAPATWTQMAAGQQDAWIDSMLTKLDALNGPVWLVMHHEPEGGEGVNQPDEASGPAGHLAMNRHVRVRMTALGTKNVSLALVLMGCSFNSTASSCPNRNPADWWDSSVYDLLGADTYWLDGSPSQSIASSTVLVKTRQFAYSRGVDVALFEWGLGATMTSAAASRIGEFYDAMLAPLPVGQARIVAASYFNTSLNNGTPLSGPVLTMFQNEAKKATSTHWQSQLPTL